MTAIKHDMHDVLNTTPIAVACSHISSGHIEYINESFVSLFGYALEDLSDIKSWYLSSCPKQEHYQHILQPFIDNEHLTSAKNLQTQIICKDGSVKHINVYLSKLKNKKLWYFTDLTDHWIAEERLRARSNMLEMVAKSSALKDILNTIVKQIQQESPQSICSILLFDKEKGSLQLGAAPDLPSAYNNAIDGVKIGAQVGSCGAAAYLQQRVIVADITSHENWVPFAQLASESGLAACWSDPIMSSEGELLGTFAIYKRFPSNPTEKDFDLINFASRLASIAIESFKAKEELEKRAYQDFLTDLGNRGHFFEHAEAVFKDATLGQKSLSIIMLDIDNFKKINDLYGHKIGDLVLKKLAEVSKATFHRDDVSSRIGGEEFAFLLSDHNSEKVLQLAETLRESIEKSSVLSSENEKVMFTASIGIAYKEAKTSYCTVEELLNKADKALYLSKNEGKNKVSYDVYIGAPVLL
ncbi:diguanylate cyclase [Marinomonas sp.]|nr:diguanylate cyclase [Marinomonas sp.]MDB4837421.1 diguanylate cyclase [Marinomonas sp.]